jgi:TonB family protein
MLISLSLMIGTSSARASGPRLDREGQSRLDEIRKLYEAAEYDRALRIADESDQAALGMTEARDLREYEALCFLAVGNRPRAAEKVEEIIKTDPSYQPSADLPKRLKGLVDDVRGALRPVLAKSHYRAGREKFAAAQYEAAGKEFSLVLELTGAAGDDPKQELTDLKLLASSFLELAERARAEDRLATAPAAPLPPAAPADAPVAEEVVPPVAIRQEVPLWPASLTATRRADPRGLPLLGMLEVAITAEGTVASAKITKPMHPLYDSMLLQAATRWRYQPATKNGTPVEYLKRIAIEVR